MQDPTDQRDGNSKERKRKILGTKNIKTGMKNVSGSLHIPEDRLPEAEDECTDVAFFPPFFLHFGDKVSLCSHSCP